MQSQMIGMQSTLDRILSLVQQQPPSIYGHGREPVVGGPLPPIRTPEMYDPPSPRTGKVFPPLPGFAPPVRNLPAPLKPQLTSPPPTSRLYSLTSTRHTVSYPAPRPRPTTSLKTPSLGPRSTRPSRLSRVSPTQQQRRRPFPLLLLQGRLTLSLLGRSILNRHRVKKRKKVEPTPRNAFPHVVEKVASILTFPTFAHERRTGSCLGRRSERAVPHVSVFLSPHNFHFHT